MADELFLSPDLNAEAGVIGCMLLDDAAAQIAIETLKPSAFLNIKNRTAFSLLADLFIAEGTLSDLFRVRSYLEEGDTKNIIGESERITAYVEDATPANIEKHCRQMLERNQKNKLKEIGIQVQTWATNGTKPDEILSKIQELLAKVETAGQESYRPKIESIPKLIDTDLGPRGQLIEGIAFEWSKISMSAPSKARKSWVQQHLALCVASGTSWYGRQVKKGRVLYMNLELAKHTLQNRFRILEERVLAGERLQEGSLDYLQLRGRLLTAGGLREFAETWIRPQSYSLIIVDPLYKLLAGKDENSAGDMAAILGELEAMASRANAALFICHHFAKGSAAGKAMLDRASGSGVGARDGDTMITITPHEDDPDTVFTLEFALRDMAPVEPVVIRWEYPIFRTDDTLAPCEHAKQGASRKWTVQDVARIAGAGMTHAELCDGMMEGLGVSQKTARRALIEAVKSGHVSNALGMYRAAAEKIETETKQESLF